MSSYENQIIYNNNDNTVIILLQSAIVWLGETRDLVILDSAVHCPYYSDVFLIECFVYKWPNLFNFCAQFLTPYTMYFPYSYPDKGNRSKLLTTLQRNRREINFSNF